MKKSLIALAALATVGAAQAQSSVTVYGSLDTSYGSTELKNASFTDGLTVKTQGINVQPAGALTSNRIGFRGEEDLGGGLKAGFNYELGFYGNLNGDVQTAQTGLNGVSTTQGAGALQTRTSRLSLSDAKLGRVDVGYGLTGLFATVTGHSPLPGNNFIGDLAYTSDSSYDYDSRILADAVRMNGVSYTTANLNGFTARVDYGAGKREFSDGRVNNLKTSNTGFTVNFANGPVALAATVHRLKADASETVTVVAASSGTAPTTGLVELTGNNTEAKVDYQALSGKFNVSSNFAVNALYANNKTTAAGAQVTKNNVTQFGVSYTMGKTNLVAQYGIGEGEGTSSATKFDRTAYQVGAIYNLSKRTNAYVIYGDQESKNTAGIKQSISGYSAGLRHAF